METIKIIMKAQHYVADAQLAFHLQLAAAFRGDFEETKRQHQLASLATTRIKE